MIGFAKLIDNRSSCILHKKSMCKMALFQTTKKRICICKLCVCMSLMGLWEMHVV